MNLLLEETKTVAIPRKILAQEIVDKITESIPEIEEGFIDDFNPGETSFSLMFEIKESELRRMLTTRTGTRAIVNKARAVIKKLNKKYEGERSIYINYINAPKKVYDSYNDPTDYDKSYMNIDLDIY